MLISIVHLTKGTWAQNYERCCSLGLRPISLESKEELECLADYVGSIPNTTETIVYRLMFTDKAIGH
jgi:hypothetical protein